MYDLKMEMEKAISHLGNAVNNFSYGEQAEEFINQLSRQHRTLQQNVWRMIANTIGEYADTEHFDLRNEDSVNFCKKVTEFMEERNVGYFSTV